MSRQLIAKKYFERKMNLNLLVGFNWDFLSIFKKYSVKLISIGRKSLLMDAY